MKKTFTLLFAALFTAQCLHAQNTFPATGATGIGTNAPNASSLLEIRSTTKGFLPPRMTIAQRNAIATPATGLMIYQTNSTPGFYYYDGSAWTAMKPKNNAWSLTGNSGTTAGANFIGTTDAQVLIFKVNSVQAGLLDYDASKSNSALGFQSLNVNTTGVQNTAMGYATLQQNTSGYSNTASGAKTLSSNSTGYQNVATGTLALSNNTTGYNNTATGAAALIYNTAGIENTANGSFSLNLNSTGNFNVANGAFSLQNNTAGYFNTATGYASLNKNTYGDRNMANGSFALTNNTIGAKNVASGVDAMFSNTTGSTNVASGFEALHNNTIGYSNVALGVDALFANTTAHNIVAIGDSALFNNGIGASTFDHGTNNTAIGSKALYYNSTGYRNSATGFHALYANNTGYNNTATGPFSLDGNTSGSANTATGYSSLHSNTTGFDNVASGVGALNNNTTGNSNTAVGNYTLIYNNTGHFNTALGTYADVSFSAVVNNATAIGSGAVATASNQVMLGSTSVMSVKAAGSFVIYSDGRFKKNIKENVPGLSFINQLRPVTYNYDIHKLNDYIKSNKNDKDVTEENTIAKKIKEDAISSKEKKIYTGFVAQEVEKVADKMGYDFSGVYKPQNENDPYGISYADFVVPLVKAVQELSAKNDDLQKQINELKAGMASASQATAANGTTQIIKLNGATSLEQNIPNPFQHTTTINYTLPQQYSKAKINITDNTGRTLKEINISGTGKGSVQIDAASISAGVYSYSLYIDDKIKESKQMILTK